METVIQMAKANGVRRYRHVLRRDDRNVLRKPLEFEVKGKRKQGLPKKTWKTQVEKELEQECWFEEGGCHKLEQDGEWELERLLLEWGKSGHPCLRG